MKILLVEDDIEISNMLRNFLLTENFEVIAAKDGAEACQLFREISFDLVLLDLMIPKISGMEVPIKRQKILASQMLAVWIFNFLALVITKLLMYTTILTGSRFMNSAFSLGFDMGSLHFYIQLILKSAVIVSMGFIALFIGIAMKSPAATIITSFLLIFLTQANIGDFTMSDSAAFPVILTVISIIFAFLSVYKAEIRDVI